MNPLKPKSCKVCLTQFNPRSSFQTTCGMDCAISLSRKQREREDAKLIRQQRAARRQARKAAKERLMTRSDHLRIAQKAFNEYIRLRDKDKPCISCGATQAVQWHAGHYRTVKTAPELRFRPFNCHKQCSQCNDFMSGNILMYRKGLIARIGLEAVEELEGPHPPLKMTIAEIQALTKAHREMIRLLKANETVSD